MSARAAWRLESLGFSQVFRYTAGKADWLANGLPIEGKQANIPHAGDLAREDIPTCRLTERIGDVQDRLQAASWNVCVVINADRVVLGLLKGKALQSDRQKFVEIVMESGPTTIRPNWTLEKTIRYLQKQGADSVLITTSDGQLIGILYREDAERRMGEAQAVNENKTD